MDIHFSETVYIQQNPLSSWVSADTAVDNMLSLLLSFSCLMNIFLNLFGLIYFVYGRNILKSRIILYEAKFILLFLSSSPMLYLNLERQTSNTYL